MIKELFNQKMRLLLKWVLFIPIGFVVYKVATIAIYFGITLLFHVLGQLHWYFFMLAILPALALLAVVVGGLWACFYVALKLSPNKILCWLLAGYFIFSSLLSIRGYCSPAPISDNGIDISLPCWGYVIFQIYIIVSLIIAMIVAGKSISKDRKKSLEKEQIKKIQSAKTGEPIELTGYGIIDPNGNDTGKRFIRKEDAEKYLDELNNNKGV